MFNIMPKNTLSSWKNDSGNLITYPPNGFHHSRVAELSGAQLTIKGEGFLEVIGLDAPHKEGLALAEGVHERVQRLPELGTESGRLLPCLLSLGRKISHSE